MTVKRWHQMKTNFKTRHHPQKPSLLSQTPLRHQTAAPLVLLSLLSTPHLWTWTGGRRWTLSSSSSIRPCCWTEMAAPPCCCCRGVQEEPWAPWRAACGPVCCLHSPLPLPPSPQSVVSPQRPLGAPHRESGQWWSWRHITEGTGVWAFTHTLYRTADVVFKPWQHSNGEENTSAVCLRTQTHGNSTHQMVIHTRLQVSPYTQLNILIFTSEKQLNGVFEVNIWAGSCWEKWRKTEEILQHWWGRITWSFSLWPFF